MTAIAETRKLTLHPLAIHTFIKAQAGSLGKALSESVMNSLDAFASNVTIKVNSRGYTIEDDGQGFQDRAEIFDWFETLGFPHDEGNHRAYGKFGLGRAQQWAYASNVWYSNQFVMRVDVQKTGLDYKLEETTPRVGTLIEGTFYSPLSFTDQQRLEAELSALVKYTPGLVTLNGVAINKDPATEQWDLETEDAYFRFDPKAYSLDVYNGGVLVNHFQRYRFQCAGVVVTKPSSTLSLNVARNDILEAECKVWQRVRSHFPAPTVTKPKEKKEPKLSTSRLKAVVQQVKDGEAKFSEMLTKLPYLVTTVHGRSVPYSDLANPWRYKTVVFVPKGDELGKRIAKLKLALVLSRDTLELWGFENAQAFRAMVLGELAKDAYNRERLEAVTWSDDAAASFPALADNKVVFATSELEPHEKAVQTAYTRSMQYLAKDLSELLKQEGATPISSSISMQLGDSPGCAAWVGDNGDLIVRRKEAVKAMEGGMSSVASHVVRSIREAYADILGPRVDELLVKLVSQGPALGKFAIRASARYIYECKQRDLPVPVKNLDELEEAGVV